MLFVFCGAAGVCSGLLCVVLPPGVGAYDDKGVAGLFGAPAEVPVPVGQGFDTVHKNRSWLNFDGWGLHLYVGKFGAGKTCTMVHDAYALAKRYPKLTIVTNLQLSGFPAHTQILPLRSPQDILNAPVNTLVLIDEIGTIFNSRDFAASKQSVPKILFQHLCQCRKRHMQIYATTQRWNFLDKQLRDITDTVRVTRSHLSHPFTRICTVYTYDAVEYDLSFSNPQYPLAAIDARVYCQTDADRNRYDTQQLIDNMLQADYISDEEILRNRGELQPEVTGEISNRSKRRIRKNKIA